MNREEVTRALKPWWESRARPAWRAVVPDARGREVRSKFCGAQWLDAAEEPLTCEECGRFLPPFVQLDLDTLPGDLAGDYGSGLLQLFYCAGGVNDDDHPACWGEGGWEPFSDSVSRVRVARTDSLAARELPGVGHGAFSAAEIASWEQFDDYPHPEDYPAQGLTRTYDREARTVTLTCPSVGLNATLGFDEMDLDEIATAAEGDKLAGWPCWIQGPEYPTCPQCGAPMRVVFQLDSEAHVPFMFGDVGIGHITQCPQHHNVVAFGWACS